MIYRSIYFKECNHVKIVFEKNAEFNVLPNCDLSNFRALGQNKMNRSKLNYLFNTKKRTCLPIFLFEILTFEICLLTYSPPVIIQ